MKFIFYTRGEVQLVDQIRDLSVAGMSATTNAKIDRQAIHRAERIFWIGAAGDVWLVKDRFQVLASELPKRLL